MFESCINLLGNHSFPRPLICTKLSHINVTLCRKWSFMPIDLYPCIKTLLPPKTGGDFRMEAHNRLRSTIYYTNSMRWKSPLLELGNQVGSKQMYSLAISFQLLSGIMLVALKTHSAAVTTGWFRGLKVITAWKNYREQYKIAIYYGGEACFTAALGSRKEAVILPQDSLSGVLFGVTPPPFLWFHGR